LVQLGKVGLGVVQESEVLLFECGELGDVLL